MLVTIKLTLGKIAYLMRLNDQKLHTNARHALRHYVSISNVRPKPDIAEHSE